jgi:hypothetical protein
MSQGWGGGPSVAVLAGLGQCGSMLEWCQRAAQACPQRPAEAGERLACGGARGMRTGRRLRSRRCGRAKD